MMAALYPLGSKGLIAFPLVSFLEMYMTLTFVYFCSG